METTLMEQVQREIERQAEQRPSDQTSAIQQSGRGLRRQRNAYDKEQRSKDYQEANRAYWDYVLRGGPKPDWVVEYGAAAPSQDDLDRRQRNLSTLFRDAGLAEDKRHDWLTWEHFTLESLGDRYHDRRIAISLAYDWALGMKLDYSGFGERFAINEPTLFVFEPSHSLVIFGKTGTGKTSLARVAYRERIAQGAVGLFIEFYDLISLIQAQYSEKDNQSHDLIQAAANAPVLVLDDVGDMTRRGQESDDKINKLWQLINRRYVTKMPTLITTNLDRDAFNEQFGKKITGRLAEMAVWAEMGGEDFRQREG